MTHYKMKCNHCGNIFVSHYKGASCPRHDYRGHGSTFIEDVLETAADAATAYFMVEAAESVLEGVGSLLGSVFD